MIDPTTLASIRDDIRNADDLIGVVQNRIVDLLKGYPPPRDIDKRTFMRLAAILGNLTSIRERIGNVYTNPVFIDTRDATR